MGSRFRESGRFGGRAAYDGFTVWELFIEVLTRTSYAAGMTLGMVATEVQRRRQSLVWTVLDLRFTPASNAATFT